MRQLLLEMPRHAKVATMMVADAVLLMGALWLALSLRYGEVWFQPVLNNILVFAVAALSGLAAFWGFGLYRWMVRYVSSQTLGIIFRALLVAGLILGTAIFFLHAELPRSTPILFVLIATILVAGSRFMAQRLLRESDNGKRVPVIIYGAGATGHQIGLSLHQGNAYIPVAYVDDNPAMHGRLAYGLRVYSPRELSRLIDEYEVEQILLAMPSASNSRRREILLSLEAFSVKVRTVPRMIDIVEGRAGADDIQDVDPGDLLGRDPVPPRLDLLGATITGKCVMVTGAGGSIGSELCRQIMALQPRILVLFDISEFSLYAIESELRSALALLKEPVPLLIPLLGSVQNGELLREVMQRFAINTVFHAAAYKHVPLVEHNVVEGVRNNVFGTREAARAAMASGVSTFVLISTDKAVRPTNIMGASKRLAELILQALAAEGDGKTRFCMVRFGNVLGSSGSVVPLFREQIKKGGPVTVTHPDIIRYFMTIPEAAQLVIQAVAMTKGGDVFLLDMGEPVKIADLAKRMIHLMGCHERTAEKMDGDIEIVYTGLRPGEKLYEELLVGGNALQTEHPRIMRALENHLPLAEIELVLDALAHDCDARDIAEIYIHFERLRIGFVSASKCDYLLDAASAGDKKIRHLA